MVREPLKLERDAANPLGARGDLRSGKRLDKLRVRGRVAHRRVARERFHIVKGTRARSADQ